MIVLVARINSASFVCLKAINSVLDNGTWCSKTDGVLAHTCTAYKYSAGVGARGAGSHLSGIRVILPVVMACHGR